MNTNKKSRENHRQLGFTLIELLVVAAILGTIGSALTGVILSTFRSTDDTNGLVEAVTGIEIAAQEMSADGMSAQSYAISGTGDGSITLMWTTPAQEGGKEYLVEYKLSGTNLQRVCTIDGGIPSKKILAQDVTGLQFTGRDSNAFVATITSTGGGTRIAETREYNIELRAGIVNGE